MQALDARVLDAVWQTVEALLPPRPADAHPLGCHRPRVADRTCFEGILWRLVTGCSWTTAGRIVGVSATTLRRRRDAWIAAGVFMALCAQALHAYDRVVGLDPSEVSIDGSLHKAPCGGEGTGPNPTDRGKLGWKWSLATDRAGIPLGWATAGANRHDLRLLGPTLDDIDVRAVLLAEIDTLHLDRGYDADTARAACAERDLHDLVIAKKRKPAARQHSGRKPRRRAHGDDDDKAGDGGGEPDNPTPGQPDDTPRDDGREPDDHHDGGRQRATKLSPPDNGGNRNSNDSGNGKRNGTGKGNKPPLGLGLRWAVERSNSWFSNFGQLRRNTDRFSIHRLAQIALAVALILTVKLIKWADRWQPRPPP